MSVLLANESVTMGSALIRIFSAIGGKIVLMAQMSRDVLITTELVRRMSLSAEMASVSLGDFCAMEITTVAIRITLMRPTISA